MSSYLSSPYSIQQPQESTNVQLVGTVLNTLQTRYDSNKSLVEQTLAKYENLRGLSDSDNAYISAKVQEAEAVMKTYGKKNGNLALSTTRDTMLSALEGIYKDPIVQNAVQNKHIYDNFNAEVSKLKEKNDGRYSDVNYNYALYKGGVQDYMEGKVKKLNRLTYIPYKDLVEEDLKKLKTIKDIKGKRFLEYTSHDGINPAPQGEEGKYKIKKEIDGLTKSEIENYFGSTISPEEITQLQINGWAKYAQPNTIAESKEAYKKYNTQILADKKQNLLNYEANKDNKNLSEDIREENRIKYEALKEDITSLESLDVNKLDPETIAFQLEKANYTNGISQMASTEWSQSLDKNETHYADEELDIAKQKLEIEKEKLLIDKTKLKKEFGVDINGNPLVDQVVAQSSKSTDLIKELSEEGAGASGLKSEHDMAYKEIFTTAKEFLANASKSDKESFTKLLESRGVNTNLQFEEGRGEGNSLANTIYQAFKDGSFDSSYGDYGKRMSSAFTIKQQRARDIANTTTQGLKETYNKNPQEYIQALKDEIYTASIDGQSDLREEGAKEDLKLARDAQAFVDSSGGWKNIQKEIEKDPNKLLKFADILDKLSKRTVKTPTFNFQRENLKKEASKKIEENIQKKTTDGSMMSIYNDFTFINDDVKERVIKMIPNQRVLDAGGNQTNRVLDEKEKVSFYKQGEKIVLTQSQKTGTKDGEERYQTFKVELDPGDSGYQEILQYVDFNPKKTVTKATATSEFQPIKVSIPSFTTDTKSVQRKAYSINSSLTPELMKPFLSAGIGNPALLATKESSEKVVEGILINKGVPTEKITEFKNKLFSNINSYKIKPTSELNIQATGYEFGLDVTKGTNNVMSINLGVSELDENLNYLINSHPHIFVITQALSNTTPSNIDAIISKL